MSYFVWRRNDGHVGATRNFMPKGWIQPNDGKPVTFEHLGTVEKWDDAIAIIWANERSSASPVSPAHD